MHIRTLPSLLPVVFMTAAAASLTAPAAHAQTLPTLTATLAGSGTTNSGVGLLDFQEYTFNFTGFSNVGPDPNNDYTVYSFSNSSIEKSPGFFSITPVESDFSPGLTYSDPNDFVISAVRGIHATDPTFALIITQYAGTPEINPTGAPVELFHQINGVDPFLGPNGQPLTITVNAVPEASSMISFGLLLLGGLAWQVRRKPRAV